MGYRIRYSHLDGTLCAVVSGKSSQAVAGCIARDIAAQAARESAWRVLVDLRWLEDRAGMRALLRLPELRVAVLDLPENDPDYVFSEREDEGYFERLDAALIWLRAERRAAPAPLAALGG